jgi:hypothetical protein
LRLQSSLILSKACRESSNVLEYFAVLREGGEAPKVVVYFRITGKRDSKL